MLKDMIWTTGGSEAVVVIDRITLRGVRGGRMLGWMLGWVGLW